MNTNLVLYQDKEFGITAGQYSSLIALNAAMVVLFQFPLTAYLERFGNTALLVAGAACYAVGFGMYGFVGTMWWFALAMAVLTVGEMILVPVAQTVVAQMAPEDMRGRYMGFYGLVWGASFGVGPLAGGFILSYGDGDYRRYLWYVSLVVGLAGAFAFLLLGRYLRRRAARIRWQEMLEKYRLQAEEGPLLSSYDRVRLARRFCPAPSTKVGRGRPEKANSDKRQTKAARCKTKEGLRCAA